MTRSWLARAARAVLPRPALELLHTARQRLLLPSARPVPREDFEERVTLFGFFSAPTGLGEGARRHAAALANLGHQVGMIDASPLLDVAGDVPLPRGSPNLVDGDIGGPLICHLNPMELRTALALRRMSGRQRRLIGYWAWELPAVPRAWRDMFRLVHEVWVPSDFVADALSRSGCPVPVRVVPHPIPPPADPPPGTVSRGQLTVLTIFAHESGFNRKNPLGAIDAFRLAFGDRKDARLIVKARGRSQTGEAERQLAAYVAGSDNIEVIDGELGEPGMRQLLRNADIALSLHRAEGFGIPLAQAMLMGKPVVATGWSGNLQFMDAASACLVPATMIAVVDNSPAYQDTREFWADPSITAAAAWLRRLEDPDTRRRIGAAGRVYAAERLGLPAFASAVAPSLGRAITTRSAPVPLAVA